MNIDIVSIYLFRLAKCVLCGVLLVGPITAFGEQVTHTYDALNRLIRSEYGSGFVVEYTYDAAGNRLSREVSHISTPVPSLSPTAIATPSPTAAPAPVADESSSQQPLTFQLLEPNGGETYKVGKRMIIRWTASNFRAKQKLQIKFSKNGGSKWKLLATVRNKGNKIWKPKKSQVTNQARLMICVPKTKKSAAVCDTSDGLFSVVR